MRFYQSIVFVLAVLGVCIWATSASDGQRHLNSSLNKTPYVYLLDTGTPSSTTLSERELTEKAGWTIVPEDNLRHKFEGDTVFLNDKITVILRRGGSGAEVYSKTADGLRERAQLISRAGGADQTAGVSSVRIIENNPAAVMLEVVFQTQQGKFVSATYRLTTGQIYLEISPGKSMDRLSIRANARYVVVPDFFGDDVVFGPEYFDDSRIGLPAENFLLHMLEGNDAIVMCVWESDKQNVEAVSSRYGQKRVISGCDIQCIKDKRIWVAFVEGSNIWHERLISDKDQERNIVLDWEPPFGAKWRADFVGKDELAESRNFRDEHEQELVSASADEPGCCCWFDGEHPYVRVPEFRTSEKSKGGVPGGAQAVIVYPIDRSRATPLRVFYPIDVLRNTLGVGPCQYILEKEGLGSESDATADQATRWIENLFKRKREKQASDQIEEHLRQMVEHMRQTQMRIKQYGDFAKQLRRLSEKQESNEAVTGALGKLWDIVDDLEQNVIVRSDAAKPSESAGHLADKIVGLFGHSDSLAQCQKLGSQIRAIAAAQDRALSKCRMAVRRIKQRCITIARREPQCADFARKAQTLAEEMLHKK